MNFIIENKEFFGIIIPLLAVTIPLMTFILAKSKEQEQLNFEKIHNTLLKGLANQEEKTGLDQQVGIIYELRNYPKYYPLINRLLNTQIIRWKKLLGSQPHFDSLIIEAYETLAFTKKNVIHRYITRIIDTWF